MPERFVDPEVLRRVAAEVGPEDAGPVLAAFSDEIRLQVARISDARQRGAYRELEASAHRLKGNAGAVGARVLEARAQQIESAAGKSDDRAVSAALEGLDALAAGVLLDLDRFALRHPG